MMAMRVSHLNALKALEATLRLGSFTKAAEELGVTSAAVGQQVRTLEKWIGQDLFERQHSGNIPKSTALNIEARLTEHISGLTEVLSDLRRPNSESRLAITLPASFAENWFARRIPEFWQEHPSLDLRLNATNRMVDIRREEFDFAIRFCDDPGADMEAIDLFEDFVAPVCTPALAQRHRLSPACCVLKDVPLIHLDHRTPDPTWAGWDIWAEAFGVALPMETGELRYREMSSGLNAARAEQGLVLAGLVEAHAALEANELVVPFGAERSCPTQFSYRLVWPRERKLNSVQTAFVDWIRQNAIDFRMSLHELLGTGPHA